MTTRLTLFIVCLPHLLYAPLLDFVESLFVFSLHSQTSTHKLLHLPIKVHTNVQAFAQPFTLPVYRVFAA